jgi:formamidopyrimidine-DNA glycosylase
MPELPDIVVYCEAIADRLQGQVIEKIVIDNPFVLRTVSPPLAQLEGLPVISVSRLGKRVVFEFESELFLVFHLMIAGRFKWVTPKKTSKLVKPKAPARGSLVRMVTGAGTLQLTEAGTQRRASLHVVASREQLNQLHRGGLEVLDCDYDTFATRVTETNRTLKRVLTDPSILSGIGNAYSDEILHHAGLSPMLQTQKAQPDALRALFDSTQHVLKLWTQRLRDEVGASKSGFPEKVTAFRDEMNVHGKFGKPCPVCGKPVQRIRYASNETNYCAMCQTDGVVLKDRSLSRLLKESWPRTLDD